MRSISRIITRKHVHEKQRVRDVEDGTNKEPDRGATAFLL